METTLDPHHGVANLAHETRNNTQYNYFNSASFYYGTAASDSHRTHSPTCMWTLLSWPPFTTLITTHRPEDSSLIYSSWIRYDSKGASLQHLHCLRRQHEIYWSFLRIPGVEV